MEKEVKIIKVEDIAEYPTELGNRCLLLRELGLNPYRNTEEEIIEVLNETASQPKYLDICLKYSRCQYFWKEYQKGDTPYFERDSIIVDEYMGKYWAYEGKHRICLAKRAGIKEIKAVVYKMDKDYYTMLNSIGEANHYQFHSEIIQGEKIQYKGEIGALWLGKVEDLRIRASSSYPLLLNEECNTKGEWIEIVKGVKFKTNIEKKKKKISLFTTKDVFSINTEIIIEREHRKTRIWLMSVPMSKEIYYVPLGIIGFTTLYRHGCWRKHHEEKLKAFCPIKI
ncbi:hypothetical protein ACAG39_02055 [Caldicellulosiruptoraceae bacterium PP1]